MKRAALLLIFALTFSTSGFAAPDKWYESYKRGVAAVNAKNYKAGADALASAIAESPTEGVGVRTRNEIVIYVPHFWLGIAKFNLGDVDGALREWKISEDQGAIGKTEYYSTLKDWVNRAQAEKKRIAQGAASGAKKAAGDAINHAVAAQGAALSAGGDRTESYRAAYRKLQESLVAYNRAGSEIEAFERVEESATQASALFTAAATEAKKQKAARAAMPKPAAQPKVDVAQTATVAPPPPKVEPKPVEPPPAPVESEAEVAARVAVQEYRRNLGDARRTQPRNRELQAFVRRETRGADALRRQLEDAKSDAEFQRISNLVATGRESLEKRIADATKPAQVEVTESVAPDAMEQPKPTETLRSAYRAFAAGDLDSSEQLLTRLLDDAPSGEAYLLRGCARYTRAVLSRAPDPLLQSATADFKAALSQKKSLRLDTRSFSPKLIAFFDQVRTSVR